MNANPKGRVDVLALSIAERLTHEKLEPRIGGVPVWDALKPLAQEGIKAGMKALGVPRRNLLDTPLGKIVSDALGPSISGGCA